MIPGNNFSEEMDLIIFFVKASTLNPDKGKPSGRKEGAKYAFVYVGRGNIWSFQCGIFDYNHELNVLCKG